MSTINSQLPFFLQLQATYDKAFEVTQTWADKVCTVIPTNGRALATAWIEQTPALREWVGPRVIHSPAFRDQYITVKNYEAAVGVKKWDVADDLIGVYVPTTKNLAANAAKWMDRELAAHVLANGVTWDGVSFFNASHPVNLDDAAAGTYSNVSTGATDIFDAIQLAFTAMTSRVGANGQLLNVAPTKMLYAPAQHAAVIQALKGLVTANMASGSSAVDAATVMNPWAGIIEPIMIQEFAGAPKDLIFIDDSKGISPFVFALRQAPEMEQLTSATDMTVFMDALYVYGVEARGAAATSLPFLAHKVTLA